ncbi:hypothetical protein [Chlorogloeopsis sp. ULAP01]|uniref:hypothetical protein n=1 Tax=Chlorogloeopsis sp. ULAP01 TaxID=3056483 RepID=UPI0025AB8DAB|nr:hypothetical protein [Chlorogloeopsis sp. ULAP01]
MPGNNAIAHEVRNCVLLLANAQVRLMWSKCWKIWECNMRLVFREARSPPVARTAT